MAAQGLLGGHKPAKGRRVAVMTTTGGGPAMVVDRLGRSAWTWFGRPITLSRATA